VTYQSNSLASQTVSAGELLLRPFEPGDEPGVAAALRDADILRWVAGRAVIEAPEAERARRWLEPRIDGWANDTVTDRGAVNTWSPVARCCEVESPTSQSDRPIRQGLIDYLISGKLPLRRPEDQVADMTGRACQGSVEPVQPTVHLVV
jgi:hypothetical protein